ncbi:hypothetical protein [Micromonospora aurantiaca (nom. illeg.)]|uniref:hypothetical protein n=1 Tax=Micromonospora aurantiaca (nom. illeg.) TaxID=47850 RepID=UPI003EBFEA97
MRQFTPGYPDDLRSERTRVRAWSSYEGDFEGAAARVVARLTGEHVVLQDDGRADAIPDLRIEYRDGRTAYGEITQDLDEAYAALGSEVLKRQFQMAAPTLGRVWWITLAASARVGRLERSLPPILEKLDASGDTFEIAVFDQRLEQHRNADVRLLAAAGVVRLASRRILAAETPVIHVAAEGVGGPAELDWASFGDYLASFVRDERRLDVRRKLAITGSDERHAFIGFSFSTPWRAWHALDEGYSELPTEPPHLPKEITHLWVWAYPLGRCIAWFPNLGWFDPRSRWTTQ